MSAVRSLSGAKRTWRGEPCLVEIDPGCVKTLLRCYDSPGDSGGIDEALR
jgi:hypothetical protein